MDIIKVLLILVIILVLLFPMMPFTAGVKKFSTIHALKYEEPHNRKNFWFIILAVLECALLIALTDVISTLADFVLSIKFVQNLLNKNNGYTYIWSSSNYFYLLFFKIYSELNFLTNQSGVNIPWALSQNSKINDIKKYSHI